jgi:hypothetical protein
MLQARNLHDMTQWNVLNGISAKSQFAEASTTSKQRFPCQMLKIVLLIIFITTIFLYRQRQRLRGLFFRNKKQELFSYNSYKLVYLNSYTKLFSSNPFHMVRSHFAASHHSSKLRHASWDQDPRSETSCSRARIERAPGDRVRPEFSPLIAI